MAGFDRPLTAKKFLDLLSVLQPTQIPYSPGCGFSDQGTMMRLRESKGIWVSSLHRLLPGRIFRGLKSRADECMRTFLRDVESGLYFSRHGKWTPDPERALDFKLSIVRSGTLKELDSVEWNWLWVLRALLI